MSERVHACLPVRDVVVAALECQACSRVESSWPTTTGGHYSTAHPNASTTRACVASLLEWHLVRFLRFHAPARTCVRPHHRLRRRLSVQANFRYIMMGFIFLKLDASYGWGGGMLLRKSSFLADEDQYEIRKHLLDGGVQDDMILNNIAIENGLYMGNVPQALYFNALRTGITYATAWDFIRRQIVLPASYHTRGTFWRHSAMFWVRSPSRGAMLFSREWQVWWSAACPLLSSPRPPQSLQRCRTPFKWAGLV
jgi:hypothetical protein